jgi:hypothetical protein
MARSDGTQDGRIGGDHSRRSVLRTTGALAAGTVALGVGATGAVGGQPSGESPYQLEKVGQSQLSQPPGAFAEVEIREDGRYGLTGSYFTGGSFLVDLSDPANPSEVHNVELNSPETLNADVKFDPRDGIYYVSQEDETGEDSGFLVVDYGFGDATPENPEVIANVDDDGVHNLLPHPDNETLSTPIVYSVNLDDGPGLDVVDVSDPANPELIRKAGPRGSVHDFVVDPERQLGHAAYIFPPDDGDGVGGYAVLDTSDPANPTLLGSFDYTEREDYTEVGKVGYNRCHFADYDPRRELAIIGDEVGTGIPGGKHVFDIGWGEGSPENPIHLAFTHSPDAKSQDRPDELFDWTTHNHDVVPRGSDTLLVDGSYHEGVVLYDITDPTTIETLDEYETDDETVSTGTITGLSGFPIGTPPMCWGANYNAKRDLIVAVDMQTGFYTFDVTPEGPCGVDVTGNGNGARDPDADGRCEDVNGNGEADVVDVQGLLANRNDPAVQNNAAGFNFNGESGVDVVDVQKLFVELT